MKYELTDHTCQRDGVTLHRIRALRSSEAGFNAGDLGGWVQSAENLSQGGEAWVYPGATVWQDAHVAGDCRISDRAEVRGRARLDGFILCGHDSVVRDDVVMNGVAVLTGYTTIFGKARIDCGEDGPQILPGSYIDFDVSYDQPYALFGHNAYAGLMIAVSSKGRICVAPTWDNEDFAGDLPAFRAWIKGRPEGVRLLAAVEGWLAR